MRGQAGGTAGSGGPALSDSTAAGTVLVGASVGPPLHAASTTGAPLSLLDVTLTFASRAQWVWDAEQAAFLRNEGTTPAVSSDGARLSAQNVVVLGVEVRDTQFKDPAGTPVPETLLVGSGEGLVASAGKHVAVTWSQESVDEPLVLTGPDDEPVLLEQGVTWVELVPREGGSWTVS